MKQELVLASAFLAGAVFASEVPVLGDKIVIDEPGTYRLSAPATVTEVDFRVPATIEGVETLTLVSPAKVSGDGRLMVPLAGTDGLTVANRYACPTGMFPTSKSDKFLLWSDAPFAAIANVQADLAGSWTGASTVSAARPMEAFHYKETSPGVEATVQFHMTNTAWAIAAQVTFTLEDGKTYAQVNWIRHGNVSKDFSHYGEDWAASGYGADYGDSFSLREICVCNFRSGQDIAFAGPFPSGTLTLNARDVEVVPSAALVLESAIAGTMETLTFKAGKTSLGDATQPTLTVGNLAARNDFVAKQVTFDGIDVTMSENGHFLPQKGSLRLVNHASCKTFSKYFDGDPNKVIPKEATCQIGTDCKLTLRADWQLDEKAVIVVDGGELAIPCNNAYVEHLTLLNGGKVTAAPITDAKTRYMTGYQTTDCYTKTTGSQPCLIDCAICGAKASTYLLFWFVFDTEADLTIAGGLGDYGTNSGLGWKKRGAATLSINGTGEKSANGCASGPFDVEAGTIRLGCDNALSKGNAFTLSGGAIDGSDFSNTLGTLAVTADSTLKIGAGSLTFADSKAMSWDGKLSVTGAATRLETGHIRFLDAGLTEAQLKPMRYNGRQRIAMDADGWLTSYTPGTAIIVK